MKWWHAKYKNLKYKGIWCSKCCCSQHREQYIQNCYITALISKSHQQNIVINLLYKKWTASNTVYHIYVLHIICCAFIYLIAPDAYGNSNLRGESGNTLSMQPECRIFNSDQADNLQQSWSWLLINCFVTTCRYLEHYNHSTVKINLTGENTETKQINVFKTYTA